MKRIFLIIIIFVLLCFAIPIVFTIRHKEIEVAMEETKNNYEYKKYSTVKLLHNGTGEVEELDIDEYLLGVVSAEMPASFEIEALKAQAIVARTYTVYKIENEGKHENADICDDSGCCQAWISKTDRMARWNTEEAQGNWDKITEAVDSTRGKIITYDGKPINAFFHSNSGGTTETAQNVWGGTNLPYLQTVETSRRRCIFSV